MILMIDNYDSFTYNIVQYVGELQARVKVIRNDELAAGEIENLNPSHVIISPGPGTPREAGVSVDVIRRCAGRVPLLGVCLGHQALGYAFGGKIVRAKKLMHGKVSWIRHDGQGVFKGLPNPFTATRYHSLAVERKNLPKVFKITAVAEDGEIMGLRHKKYPCLEGVQFHPESILTKNGRELLRNFLKMKIEKPSR